MATRSKTALLALVFILGLLAVVYAALRSSRPRPAEKETPSAGLPSTPPERPLPSLRLNPDEIEIAIGGQVAIDLILAGFAAVQGVEITLVYDPDLLQVFAVDSGLAEMLPGDCPHPDLMIRQEIDRTTGIVHYAAVSTSGGCAEGVLVTIGFICHSPGRADLALTQSTISDQIGTAIPHDTLTGSIQCSAPLADRLIPATTPEVIPVTVTPIALQTETNSLPATPTLTLAVIQTPTGSVFEPELTVTSTAGTPPSEGRVYTLYIPYLVDQGATLYVSPSAQTTMGNSAFEIMAAGFFDLYGGDITLSFDPGIIQITQVTAGTCPFPDLVIERRFDNRAGTVDYAVTQLRPTAPCLQGPVLTVAFVCVGKGSTFIGIPASLLANPGGFPVVHQTRPGVVTCR